MIAVVRAEGTADNIFIVSNGTLLTPLATEGALAEHTAYGFGTGASLGYSSAERINAL